MSIRKMLEDRGLSGGELEARLVELEKDPRIRSVIELLDARSQKNE